MSDAQHPASFRDPSGFLFTRDGILYRQINRGYAGEYEQLIESGLYATMVKAGRMIPHEEVEIPPFVPGSSFKVVQPEPLAFISYPYEWTFPQLKEAALVTLLIQERALKAGMSLKDASAYNIQFHNGRALLIDTLSFERYQPGQPWVAYKQFCQHFLAPLALMAKQDIRLGQLLRVYIDGIPLDLASQLLPPRTKLDAGLMMHIHLHAKAQQQFADTAIEKAPAKKMREQSLLGMIESLKKTVKKLSWTPPKTEWGTYYETTNYSEKAFAHKKQLVSAWIQEVVPSQVWDLGANNGVFSRLATEQGGFTVAFDNDPAAVEQNYRQMRKNKEITLLPLLLDLTNPSPAIGWSNTERDALLTRGPADMVLALALVHHLAISNNTPLPSLAQFFSQAGKWLIVEFVPKSDEQVQKLLQNREDIFDHYTQDEFERAFESLFTIHKKEPIHDSQRILYLMEKR